jgi:hypothetical protein
MEQPLHHVLIIGCGLLGASLGLALKKRGLARTITGIGRRGSPSVEIAQQRGAIDRAFDDPAEPARDADIHAAVSAGGLINFYNPLDFALGGSGNIEKQPWILNHNTKPDYGVAYVDGGPFQGFWQGSRALSSPADTYTIYAFGAEAHSLPLGREGDMVHTGGIFDSALDLNATFGFGNAQNSSHSAEFLSTNMWRHLYYQNLLTYMGFSNTQHWIA